MNGSPTRDCTQSRHSPGSRHPIFFHLLLTAALATAAGPLLRAQTAQPLPAIAAALPDAPQPQATSSVSGTVTDQNGAALPHVTVTIAQENASFHRSVRTNHRGAFQLDDLPAGDYTVSVTGPGVQPAPPQPLVLAPGQARQFPIAVTAIPRFTSTVKVTASTTQIATAQVHVEEQQRVLGVVPNFYTSFEWNAAPMTTKLKFHLAARSFIDPFSFFTDAAIAGAEQYHNTYPGYGPGWPGFGKRFGATVADSFDSRIIGNALLPALFHQDPRYFFRGKGSWGRRLVYAVGQTFVCRSDRGGEQLAYSRIAGAFAAAGISNVYHSPEDRSTGLTIRDSFVILGGNAAENVLREFLSRGLTSHVPPNANGKP